MAVGLAIENEVGVLTPPEEQRVVEAGLGDSFEKLCRDDLVSVDVAALERDCNSADGRDLVH